MLRPLASTAASCDDAGALGSVVAAYVEATLMPQASAHDMKSESESRRERGRLRAFPLSATDQCWLTWKQATSYWETAFGLAGVVAETPFPA